MAISFEAAASAAAFLSLAAWLVALAPWSINRWRTRHQRQAIAVLKRLEKLVSESAHS